MVNLVQAAGAMPELTGVCRAGADARTVRFPAVVPTKADPRVGRNWDQVWRDWG